MYARRPMPDISAYGWNGQGAEVVLQHTFSVGWIKKIPSTLIPIKISAGRVREKDCLTRKNAQP